MFFLFFFTIRKEKKNIVIFVNHFLHNCIISFNKMASLLEISSEVADKYDNNHLEKLYCVCRICYQLISGTASPVKKQPLSLLVIDRTNKFYGIYFSFELTDLSKPN